MSTNIDLKLYKELCDINDIDNELRKYNDYELLYNFSGSRKNLYEWYDFDENARLLEVGSECGILTSFFASRVKEVVSIEIDSSKAEINTYRNRNRNNVRVINTSAENLEIEGKFKYIILTGTLDNSQKYEQSDIQLLKKLAGYLEDDGVILLAASNLLGLNRLAGVSNDDKEPFKGFSSKNSLKTLRELKNLITESGLYIDSTYYPMPNYYFVTSIYSDDYLPLPGDYNLGGTSYSPNSLKLFDEAALADTLLSKKEFENYANSYLFVLKVNE